MTTVIMFLISVGGGASLFPEHPNPAMRARMGAPHPGLSAGMGKQVRPSEETLRSSETSSETFSESESLSEIFWDIQRVII